MFREGLTNCFFRGSGKRCRPKLGRVLFGGSDCFNKEGGRSFCKLGESFSMGLRRSLSAMSRRLAGCFSGESKMMGVCLSSGLRLFVASVFAVCSVSVLCTESFAAPDKVASKTAAAKAAPAGAVGAKKNAAPKPAAPKKKAPPKPTKPLELTAPAMAGVRDVVSPDSKAIKTPDKGKSIASAKSFSEQLKELEKGKNQSKKKKPVRMRKQVIDGKVCVWGRTAEDAEMYASEAIRKFVGRKANFRVKDSVFVSDSPKFICMVRFNYSDEMPETWFLETEMVTGFGKSKERAYADAICKATTRVKNVQRLADWKSTNSSTKNATEMGMIPYDYLFATIGKETYCKIFFRYLMPR